MKINRIYRNAGILLVLAAGASAAGGDWKFPLGVIVGGVLGLLNLRGMVRGLEDLTLVPDPKASIMFKSLIRLFILSLVIIILAMTRTVHLVGLLVGFTVVLLSTITEGFRTARKE